MLFTPPKTAVDIVIRFDTLSVAIIYNLMTL